jgi:hypothetical protein
VHVPETWQRAERERRGRFALLRLIVGGAVVAATVAAAIFGVVAWARGRSDRRALAALAALSFALSLVAAANAWPAAAMSLATTEPLSLQVTLGALRRIAGALAGALAIGLLGGLAAHAAAHRAPRPIAGRLPPWAAGAAAALFASGIAALLARVAPRTSPLWPDEALMSLASPALGAITTGARTLVAIVVVLFVLALIERATADWRRRRWTVALLLVAMIVANGIAEADPAAAIARGVAAGVALLAVVLGVLRFDASTVPAFVAVEAALAFTEDAVRGGWPAAPVHAIEVAAVAAAFAWLATRYVVAARAGVGAVPPSTFDAR